jgi:hypothetical protein
MTKREWKQFQSARRILREAAAELGVNLPQQMNEITEQGYKAEHRAILFQVGGHLTARAYRCNKKHLIEDLNRIASCFKSSTIPK